MTLLLSGCDWGLGSHYSSTTKTAYVDYYQEACSSDGTDMCYRMRFDTNDDFLLSTVPTTGFDDLEWGKRYTLQVEAERDSAGKDTSYRLDSIDNEEVVDAATNPFVLTFSMSSQILLENSSDSWIISAEDIFDCIESDCVLLTNSYNSNEKIQLEFTALDDKLTLVKVACSAAENEFASECEGVNKMKWDVAHYQSDCGAFDPKLCLIYRESNSSNDSWYIWPFGITGFSASWGTEYELEVEVTTSAGSLRSARLLTEISTADKEEESFIVVMRTGVKGLAESDSGVLTYDGIKFNCELNDQCASVNAAIQKADSDSERVIALQVRSKTLDEVLLLTVEALTCEAASDEFQENCADDNDQIIWVQGEK